MCEVQRSSQQINSIGVEELSNDKSDSSHSSIPHMNFGLITESTVENNPPKNHDFTYILINNKAITIDVGVTQLPLSSDNTGYAGISYYAEYSDAQLSEAENNLYISAELSSNVVDEQINTDKIEHVKKSHSLMHHEPVMKYDIYSAITVLQDSTQMNDHSSTEFTSGIHSLNAEIMATSPAVQDSMFNDFTTSNYESSHDQLIATQPHSIYADGTSDFKETSNNPTDLRLDIRYMSTMGVDYHSSDSHVGREMTHQYVNSDAEWSDSSMPFSDFSEHQEDMPIELSSVSRESFVTVENASSGETSRSSIAATFNSGASMSITEIDNEKNAGISSNKININDYEHAHQKDLMQGFSNSFSADRVLEQTLTDSELPESQVTFSTDDSVSIGNNISSEDVVVDECEAPPCAESDAGENDFQTFGEWREKILQEEQEKENEKVKYKSQVATNTEAPILATAKHHIMRVNYAAEKCGAKVLAFNPESENVRHILTPNKDEYLITPCHVKKWFVIELCQPVSIKMIEMGSLELFSSLPRSFCLMISDRYPAKEWLSAGTYSMTADKHLQSFALHVTSSFFKYLHVELLSHYGGEHYCPITMFRVFGLPMEDEDDDNENGVSVQQSQTEVDSDDHWSQTLFARTKDTVVSLVKKVLFKGDGEQVENISGANATDVERTAPESSVDSSGDGGSTSSSCDPSPEAVDKRLSLADYSVCGRPTGGDGAASGIANRSLGVDTGIPLTEEYRQTVPNSTETVEVNAGQHRNVAIVTKLVDSEQIEMEGSEHFGAGGVVLETEAKSARISLHLFFWKAALKYCLDDGDSFISCSTVPFLCRYAQVLVGYPVPMCFATSAQHQSLVYGQLFHSTEDRVVSKLKAKHEATVIVGKKMTPLPEANDASSKTAFDAELASFHSLNSLVSSPAESENTMMNSELISGSKLTLDQISEGNGDLNNSHNPFPTPVNTTSCYQSETPVDRHTAFSGQSSLPLSENTVTVQSVHTQLTHGRLQQDVDTVAMKETVDSNEFLKNASDYVDDNLVHLDGSQPLGHVISSLSSETLIDSKMTSSRTLQTPAHFTAHNDLNSSDASISDLQSAAQAIKVSPTPVEDDSMNTVTLQFGSVSTTPFPAVLHDVFESNPHGIPPVSQHSVTEIEVFVVEMEKAGESDMSSAYYEMESVSFTGNSNTGQTIDAERKLLDEKLVHVPPSQSVKRETAIMRLTNRLKALEVNVSLSSRFLEEWSGRFKRQNEEVLRLVDKTLSKFNITTLLIHNQLRNHFDRLGDLEMRMDSLTVIVSGMVENIDVFTQQVSDRQMAFTMVNLVILVLLVVVIYRARRLLGLRRVTQPSPYTLPNFISRTVPHSPQPLSHTLCGKLDVLTGTCVGAFHPVPMKKTSSNPDLSKIKHMAVFSDKPDFAAQLNCVKAGSASRRRKRKKNKAFKTAGDIPPPTSFVNSSLFENGEAYKTSGNVAPLPIFINSSMLEDVGGSAVKPRDAPETDTCQHSRWRQCPIDDCVMTFDTCSKSTELNYTCGERTGFIPSMLPTSVLHHPDVSIPLSENFSQLTRCQASVTCLSSVTTCSVADDGRMFSATNASLANGGQIHSLCYKTASPSSTSTVIPMLQCWEREQSRIVVGMGLEDITTLTSTPHEECLQLHPTHSLHGSSFSEPLIISPVFSLHCRNVSIAQVSTGQADTSRTNLPADCHRASNGHQLSNGWPDDLHTSKMWDFRFRSSRLSALKHHMNFCKACN